MSNKLQREQIDYRNLLHEGMEFKTYKELCIHLGQKVKDGKSKRLQEIEWKRHFEYEKDKWKYLITKVYKNPLPKVDKRIFGNNSEYVQPIEKALIAYLTQQEDYTDKNTLKNWFYKLGMINHNYIKEDYYIQLLKKEETFSEYDINHFYQRTYEKLRRILLSSLSNLKRRDIIRYKETMLIQKVYEDGTYEIARATKKEKGIIKEVEEKVLIDFGIRSKALLHLKFKHRKFYQEVSKILLNEHSINNYFTEIELSVKDKSVVNNSEFNNLHVLKKELNEKVIDAINEQAFRKFEKNREDFEKYIEENNNLGFGDINSIAMSKQFRLNDDYLEKQKELADKLIQI